MFSITPNLCTLPTCHHFTHCKYNLHLYMNIGIHRTQYLYLMLCGCAVEVEGLPLGLYFPVIYPKFLCFCNYILWWSAHKIHSQKKIGVVLVFDFLWEAAVRTASASDIYIALYFDVRYRYLVVWFQWSVCLPRPEYTSSLDANGVPLDSSPPSSLRFLSSFGCSFSPTINDAYRNCHGDFA